MLLSVLVPCFNEEDSIIPFCKETIPVLKKICAEKTCEISEFELIFIDDGSKDKTLSIIKTIAEEEKSIYYISFTRNFGKEAAMLAGLQKCHGDYVTLLDVDLQDPPSLMPKMIKILEENDYECVATRRVTRKGEPVVRSFFARWFYKIINKVSDISIVDGARDFRIMTRRMVDSILELKEKSRFSKGLFVWAGYKTYYIEYENIERKTGNTKWSFWKLFKYSLDGITAFSIVPLQISSLLGIICCFASLIAVLYFVIIKLTAGIEIQGYALMVCSLYLLGGMLLLGLGVLGQYVGKLYIESKQRPDYVIISESVTRNSNDNNKL